MKGKKKSKVPQVSLLQKTLLEQLNPNDPLMKLSKVFPWETIENEFTRFYAVNGRPAKPIRLMVGLLILKQLMNLSDERIVVEWTRNPYYQAFCGEHYFQWEFPCEPSDITHFRHRIGEDGCKKLLQISVELHGSTKNEEDVVIDTTVQEKNITFPTDTKLHVKIISKCRKFARSENIKLRQSYVREEKMLLRSIRFDRGQTKKRHTAKARRRIKTIAGRLVRDVSNKMQILNLDRFKQIYEKDIALFKQVLNQNRDSKHKIYSLHEPQVACITKNKIGKKYEFGCKASICMTKQSCIILGVASFENNPYDGDTLEKTLNVVNSICGYRPKRAFCDRGYRGRHAIDKTIIAIPESPSKASSQKERKAARKNFGRRSAIEPIIGHIKHDFRLCRNYLKGVVGDSINLLMAAAAFNIRKWLRKQPLCHILALDFTFKQNVLFSWFRKCFACPLETAS